MDDEIGFSIRHRDRHDDIAGDRRVLLEHPLVSLETGLRHIDRLVAYLAAYSRRVNFTAIARKALRGSIAADTGASWHHRQQKKKENQLFHLAPAF